MDDIQAKVNKIFTGLFGKTSLLRRQRDIFNKALELKRETHPLLLKEKTGDLLCSIIQLANEFDWPVSELADTTLEKIEKRKMQYKTLEKKMNIAILGGAFNPVTKGHMQIASFVLDAAGIFDEVWIMPCFKHLYNKVMVSEEHRLAMCSRAAAKDARVRVFDYEIRKQFEGGTYYLMKQMLDEDFIRTQYDISLVIGQDNANTFHQWVKYGELEHLIRFVVVPRQGIEIDQSVDWYLKPPHVYLAADKPIIKVSSTQVRELLYSGQTSEVKKLLDPDVFSYIREHRLYQHEEV